MFVGGGFQSLPYNPHASYRVQQGHGWTEEPRQQRDAGQTAKLFSKEPGVYLLKELVYFSLRQVPQRQSQTGTGPDSQNITITMRDRGGSDGRCQVETPCSIRDTCKTCPSGQRTVAIGVTLGEKPFANFPLQEQEL